MYDEIIQISRAEYETLSAGAARHYGAQKRWQKDHLPTISTKLSTSEAKRFEAACTKQGRTRYAVMYDLVMAWTKKQEKREKRHDRRNKRRSTAGH